MSRSDVLILLGLVLFGAGLFFWLGAALASTIFGMVVFFLGIAANIAEQPKIPTGRHTK